MVIASVETTTNFTDLKQSTWYTQSTCYPAIHSLSHQLVIGDVMRIGVNRVTNVLKKDESMTLMSQVYLVENGGWCEGLVAS